MADDKQTAHLGKSINDYLNHYVLVADGKAAAIAAASLVLIGFAIDIAKAEPTLKLIGILIGAAAAIAAGFVLYPRTPHSGNGHLFWADIRSFESASAYWTSLRGLNDESIGLEYARQNYLVSGVLIRKNAHVRRAIWLFVAACIVLAASFGAR